MGKTPEQAVKILTELETELSNRQPDVKRFSDAYAGEFEKLPFASEDFSDYFRTQYEGFSDNWTQVVADAPHERLEVTGIRHKGAEDGDQKSWDAWIRNDADHFSDLAFLDGIIAKRSYALIWGDSDDKARITWEHPSQAIVGYNPETRERVAGAKIWSDEKTDFATLYLPDEVWKFERERGSKGVRESGLVVPSTLPGGWVPRQPPSDDTWPIENPLGVVPLVEHQNKSRLIGEPMSDIAGTLSMQHAINLLWAQVFVAADETSLSARVITGAERPTIPILNDEGQEVGRKPVELKKLRGERIYWLEDPNAKVNEWSGANFDAFTKVIDKCVGHISSQSRTPATYFMGGGSTIANVGDKSLLPLETGLIMRTREKTQNLGRSVREDFRLMALVEGDKGRAESIALGSTTWRDIETRSDAEKTDALQKKRAMGYPLRKIMELDGMPDQEINRVMEMVEAEGQDAVLAGLLRPTAGTVAAEVTDAPDGA